MVVGYGKGGDVGGILAFVLGLVAFILGLPWNIVLAIAWGTLAQELNHPAWLGNTRNEWFSVAAPVAMSAPGAFINGVIFGWRDGRRRSSLPSNSKAQPTP
jgi:hypothetical protein